MDAGLAGHQQLIRRVVAAGVFERAVLRHVEQPLHVLHMRLAVDLELRVQALEPVRLAGERNVVQRAVLFELDPAQPRAWSSGFRRAFFVLDRLRRRHDLGPGRRRLVRIEAGLAERVLAVPHHRSGGVERHRRHPSVRQAVVAAHRRDVRLADRSARRSPWPAPTPASSPCRRRASSRCRPRRSAPGAAPGRHGTRRSSRSAHRHSRPCRSPGTSIASWLWLNASTRWFTSSPSAAVIACHQTIFVFSAGRAAMGTAARAAVPASNVRRFILGLPFASCAA